ncbi:hypothetical protein OOU_Y34scaffold00829g1 [Pyricularia oryzae Y34]|uniref:Uncharacterized protein n=3 Tax=Pyricularia oryzae TaxID=318829 RepID=Q2KER1_PYRO7|nr:hypothetical protein MGCH7_ch7g975 [Pyricularia oryzae 70-15]ELQ34001.1 hypothetical protein OOU_Y34scaffold00829g1 [Pyricularia oryzae Y34]
MCGGVLFTSWRGTSTETPAHFLSRYATLSTYESSSRLKNPSRLQALQR